jgi:hypothetical protein
LRKLIRKGIFCRTRILEIASVCFTPRHAFSDVSTRLNRLNRNSRRSKNSAQPDRCAAHSLNKDENVFDHLRGISLYFFCCWCCCCWVTARVYVRAEYCIDNERSASLRSDLVESGKWKRGRRRRRREEEEEQEEEQEGEEKEEEEEEEKEPL